MGVKARNCGGGVHGRPRLQAVNAVAKNAQDIRGRSLAEQTATSAAGGGSSTICPTTRACVT